MPEIFTAPRRLVGAMVYDPDLLDWVAMLQPGSSAGPGTEVSITNSSIAVTGPLTDTQLRATPVPVSGTVTATGGLTDTQIRATPLPVSGTVAVTNTGLSNIPSQGQAVAGSSLPVVLPAAQITTLTPPAAITGFALEAGHLATIDTSTAKIPSQGQALAGGSLPVVLTAVQVSALTPPAAITGYALESSQLTGNTSVASVKTNTDPLVTSGGGGYVRQDSTATIAKESGGNLATLAAKDFATTAKQDTGNTTLATLNGKVTAVDTGAVVVASSALPSNAATESGNLAAILARLAPLIYAQAAAGAALVGPMVQGLVNDTPDTYFAGVIQPLSLTAEGRLRVSSVESTLNHIWQDTFSADPWDDTDSPWGAFPSSAQSAMTSAGES